MAAATDLRFNVSALDKASSAFIRMAQKVENLSDKLDELDRKRAEPTINVDTDRATREVNNFADTSVSVMAGAFRIVSANAIVLGGAVVAAIALMPAAAALAAVGITLAFGGAFAAIGLAAAAQSKKVRREFTDLKDDVVDTLKEISKPFRGTLLTIAEVAQGVFDTFKPHLEKAFEEIAPVLSVFVRNFGSAFAQLAPAIDPLVDAFIAILEDLGPELIPLFQDIATQLEDLADTVLENSDLLAKFFGAVLQILPGVISLVDEFVERFASGAEFFAELPGNFALALSTMLAMFKGWVLGMLEGITMVLGAMSAIPGPIGLAAKKGLESLEGFRKGVESKFNDAIQSLNEWGNALRNAPKVAKLEGDIRDLKQKIAEAKERLRRAPKGKKMEIRGDIKDLQRKLHRAQGELAQLQDKNVTVTLTTINRQVFRRSGMKIRARGGPVDRGDVALVGEEGPEIVQFGASGTVIPANRTARMIRDVGGSSGSSSGGGGGFDARALGKAVARAINGATLIIQDNGRGRLIARQADLYERAG